MEESHNITLTFNVHLSDIESDFNSYIRNKCESYLTKNIYDGYFIKQILKTNILKDKKININGSISVKTKCYCEIINPVVDSIISIKINDVNKMGYSYKLDKICIFIPNHLCIQTYKLNELIKIKIIGKRIEESIVCIGQPV